MLTEEGVLAQSPEEAAARWARHFAGVEGGTFGTLEQLWCDKKHRFLENGYKPVHIQEGELPSLCDL